MQSQLKDRAISGPLLKPSYLSAILCGVALMSAFTTLGQSKPSQHVYELRMYHVNEGKMDEDFLWSSSFDGGLAYGLSAFGSRSSDGRVQDRGPGLWEYGADPLS